MRHRSRQVDPRPLRAGLNTGSPADPWGLASNPRKIHCQNPLGRILMRIRSGVGPTQVMEHGDQKDGLDPGLVVVWSSVVDAGCPDRACLGLGGGC